MNRITPALALAAATLPLTGCVMVGYSSRGGFFMWPGSLGLILIVFVLWLLFRNR